MGTVVTPARNDIVQEEVQTGSSVSEATFTKIAGSINAINQYWYHSYSFIFNGPFHSISPGGEDGLLTLPWNGEIVAITGHCKSYGTSGNTVIDIHKIDGSTDEGSVLTTKLTLANTVTDGTVFGKNYLLSTESTASGITLPVFSTRNFDAYDAIRVDIDSNAVSARNLSINVWFRARV